MDTKFLYLAELGFKAYNEQAGGKTWDGKDIPPFSEVGEKVQANWCAAAKAIWEDAEKGMNPSENPESVAAAV